MNNHQCSSIKQLGIVANIFWSNQGHLEYQFILPYEIKIKCNYPPLLSMFIMLMHLKFFQVFYSLCTDRAFVCVCSWEVCVNRLSVLLFLKPFGLGLQLNVLIKYSNII